MSFSQLNNNVSLNGSASKPNIAFTASTEASSHSQSPEEFSKELIKISISHLLFHIGFDRIHGAALGVLADLLEQYMALLAKKASLNAANALRTKPCLFDLELGSNTLLAASSLEKYLNDILSSKSVAMKNGGFPRLAPESLVINLTDLEGLLRGGDNDQDMQMEQDEPELASCAPTAKPHSLSTDLKGMDDKQEEKDEDGDIEMDAATEEPAIMSLSVKQEEEKELIGINGLSENDQETPFPPIPSELQEQEFMQYVESRQVVPTWESEALRRQQEEEDHEGDLYYFTQQLDENLDAFLNLSMNDKLPNKVSEKKQQTPTTNGNGSILHANGTAATSAMNGEILPDPKLDIQNTHPQGKTESTTNFTAPSGRPSKPSMDDLLRRAIESHILNRSHYDTKSTAPLIPHKSLLTLLAFRSGQHLGVAVPDGNGGGSSGYETKSILSDLLLLRTPALPFLYGGDTDLEPDGRLASEVYQMPRTRKKEKARDSGQGKAPVKTAEQKAARKKMMEEAAARKKQSLAEAAVRREVKYLAKLERAESKGIKLDPASLARKEELKKRVGGIIITRKETKRDKAKKERLAAEEAAKAANGNVPQTGASGEAASSSVIFSGLLQSDYSTPSASIPITAMSGAVSSTANSPSASSIGKIGGPDVYSDDDDDDDGNDDAMDQDHNVAGTSSLAAPAFATLQTQHHQPPPLPLPKSPISKKKPLAKQAAKSSPPIKLKLASAPTASGSPRKVVLKLSTAPKHAPALQQPPSATSNSLKSAEEKILCICVNPTIDYGQFMVCCETCMTWFHGPCVGWAAENTGDFYCKRCG